MTRISGTLVPNPITLSSGPKNETGRWRSARNRPVVESGAYFPGS
jgi:hypothetical protein